ncbi:MAG: glycoside hydrolase family 127 protein, partial [Symbiobacteriaceae bacterium]|nr:glycoside hydrolase family 127 protein [Symbiobacteriaceae bacterium]
MYKILKDNQMGNTRITGGLLRFYQELLVDKMVPYQLGIWESREPMKSLKKAAGHHIDDVPYGSRAGISSTLLEAVGYSLMLREDPALQAQMDDMIDALEACQLPSGYLNLGGNPE